jgi:co-chaperonin GroES (HSP10)
MSKFTPVSDIVVLEKFDDTERICLPDGAAVTPGDTFIVKDIGEGYYNEYTGGRVKPDVKIGDRVFLMGKVLELPFNGSSILVARERDVIGYIREELNDQNVN